MATATDANDTGPDDPAAGAAAADPPSVITDGRQLRRQRNREAVVEALLDLYSEGDLNPSTEEIAARSGLSPRSLFRYFDDVDDLISTAVDRQRRRAIPLVPIGASIDAPLATKVTALVDQRFRLFAAVGNAAAVSRLRSPFQPLLAAELARNRAFLRSQMGTLFAPELAVMGPEAAARTLAAADVLTSYESHHLLRDDQGLSTVQAKAAMAGALVAILGHDS